MMMTRKEQDLPENKTKETSRVAILISFSGDGGVEKMVCNLASGFISRGVEVDFVLIKAKGEHVNMIPQGSRVIKLGASSSLGSLPWLVKYLRQNRPEAMLAAKDRAGRAAVLARKLSGVPVRIVLRLGMHLSESLKGKSLLQKALRYYPARWFYPMADAIVCVSRGVVEDLVQITGLDQSRFRVIPNPVITPDLHRLASEPLKEDWFADPSIFRVLAVGRFTRQKDFFTLLHAFARVYQEKNCRLLILGEGPERTELEAEVERLGLRDAVKMPGFAVNPYSYMSRADLFVLSSIFEGSPNVLKEALALGAPVVSTDCKSGPRDILQDGKYGPLVPIQSPDRLAQAMKQVLEDPPDRSVLPEAVSGYTIEASSSAYLEVLGISPG